MNVLISLLSSAHAPSLNGGQMDPLSQLKDIHLPQEVGTWPPAPGWWILAIITMALLVMATVWLVKRHRFNQAKREAKNLLSSVDFEQSDWPMQLNALLKRLALSYSDRSQCASLHNKSWLEFLTAQLPKSKRGEFNTQYAELLEGLYQNKATNLDSQRYKNLIEKYITNARFVDVQKGGVNV